jgi:hypothetical protein
MLAGRAPSAERIAHLALHGLWKRRMGRLRVLTATLPVLDAVVANLAA